MKINTIYCGDALETLTTFPDECVQCVVTSPPYWGLRDYGVGGQLGLEKTPEEYVAKMVEVFREVRRVLRKDGVCFVNLGDTYNAMQGNGWNGQLINRKKDRLSKRWGGGQFVDKTLPSKNLIGIPWRVALALQADGWYLRQDIIWSKPNPMPESVTDRCTKSHEYIFLLSRAKKYFFNLLKEPANYDGRHDTFYKGGEKDMAGGAHERWQKENGEYVRNKRSVWTIPPKPYPEAHFATFPPELPEICIKAGTKEGDVVLDPFMGSGTTAWVARKLGRQFVGIELNPEYIKLCEKRLQQQFLFLSNSKKYEK